MSEKTEKRKSNGVYYTPNDVSDFIVSNTLRISLDNEDNNMYSTDECIKKILKNKNKNKVIYEYNCIDPTCGSGDFIRSILEIKLKAAKVNDEDSIIRVVKTIYGNDIDEESTDITKLRIYLLLSKYLKNEDGMVKVAKILLKQLKFTAIVRTI